LRARQEAQLADAFAALAGRVTTGAVSGAQQILDEALSGPVDDPAAHAQLLDLLGQPEEPTA
jgi:hypothetical protein